MGTGTLDNLFYTRVRPRVFAITDQSAKFLVCILFAILGVNSEPGKMQNVVTCVHKLIIEGLLLCNSCSHEQKTVKRSVQGTSYTSLASLIFTGLSNIFFIKHGPCVGHCRRQFYLLYFSFENTIVHHSIYFVFLSLFSDCLQHNT